jgi:hypothetical protein
VQQLSLFNDGGITFDKKTPSLDEWCATALACTDVYLWHTYKGEIHSA